MKYFTLGAIVATGLILGTHVFAATALKGLSVINSVSFAQQTVTRYTDQDTGVNCYTFAMGMNPGGISCVK